MIEYKAYHKKSLGKKRGRHSLLSGKRKEREASRPRKAMLRRALPVAAVLLAVVLVTASGAAVYSWLGRSRLFSVLEIDMNACEHVAKEEVWGILAGGGGNIFASSAEEIGRRLRTHPWIRRVSVRKSFPDRLVVRIEENRPAAMMNLDGLYYVDDQGRIFKRITAYDSKDFPVITGFSRADVAAKDAVTLRNLRKTIDLLILAEAGVLRKNVSEAHFDAQEGFTLVTRDTGLQIKVGAMEAREAVQRIEEAMPTLSRLGQVQGAVDLKHAGRIFVRSGE
jgi:cell division protein FtsQ